MSDRHCYGQTCQFASINCALVGAVRVSLLCNSSLVHISNWIFFSLMFCFSAVTKLPNDHLPSFSVHLQLSHTPPPPPGPWPGSTVGIFGISHHHWPRAVALQRVQNEHEEIEEEHSSSHDPNSSNSNFLSWCERNSESESKRSLKQRFPHQLTLVWGFVALFHCWGPPQTPAADPWS